MADNFKVSLRLLSGKLATVFVLTSASRFFGIHNFDTSFMMWSLNEYIFVITKLK